MLIYYWENFNKRKNSTRLPSGNGTPLEVQLKNGTSVENPVFLIAGNKFNINYIKALDHFYFVTDITSVRNNLTEIACEQDVLASYRNHILNYECFIERSTSWYDEMMEDNLVSNSLKVAAYEREERVFTGIFDAEGCYIVRFAGSGTSEDPDGVVTYCVKNLSTLSPIFNRDSYFIYSEDDMSSKFANFMFNPFDFVLSVSYSPFSYSYMKNFGAEKSVYVKWFDTGMKALRLSSQGSSFGTAFTTKPRYYNDFRDFSNRFTYSTLYLPGIGQIDISEQALQGTLNIQYVTDFDTGNITVRVSSSGGESSNLETLISGNLYSPIQIGSDASNGFQIAGSLTSSAISALTENKLAAVEGLVSSVSSLIKPTPVMSGYAGNATTLKSMQSVLLSTMYLESGNIPDVVAGRPLYKNGRIGLVQGFCKCGNASIDIAGFSGDKDMINNYLNTGFYVE